jgi:hypothetical protein
VGVEVEVGVVLEVAVVPVVGEAEALGFDVDDGVRWMVCWGGFLAA